MNIRKWGYDYRHPAGFSIDRPEGSGDFMLLVVRSPAWFELGGERQETHSDGVVLYRKGAPQRYGALGEEYVNDWLHFDADEEDLRLLSELELPFEQWLPLGSVRPLSELIRSVCEEMRSESPYGTRAAALYGRLFWLKLAELLRIERHGGMQSHYEKLRGIRNAIYHAPDREWQVDDLSRDAALSRSYFQHLYRSFFGVSVMRDVIESRISHAKYLLQSTDESVGSIALSCGYRSDVHFMRQFRKNVGESPTEYRRRREPLEHCE